MSEVSYEQRIKTEKWIPEYPKSKLVRARFIYGGWGDSVVGFFCKQEVVERDNLSFTMDLSYFVFDIDKTYLILRLVV